MRNSACEIYAPRLVDKEYRVRCVAVADTDRTQANIHRPDRLSVLQWACLVESTLIERIEGERHQRPFIDPEENICGMSKEAPTKTELVISPGLHDVVGNLVLRRTVPGQRTLAGAYVRECVGVGPSQLCG